MSNAVAKPVAAAGDERHDRGAQWTAWAYILVLAWAPFPLGSNRPWSWSLLIGLIAICWLLRGFFHWREGGSNWLPIKRYSVPFVLVACTILWAIVQALPIVPQSWAHPIWNVASSTLHTALSGTISINPWRTLGEALKLCAYAMALWLTYLMAQRTRIALLLLDAIVFIGAAYGIYSAALKLFGWSQFQLFYTTTPVLDPFFSGPFVLHNSYATYAGLISLVALARLFGDGKSRVVTTRGARQLLLSSTEYIFGSGLLFFLSFLVTFSTLLASASRAGTFATVCGLIAMLLLTFISQRSRLSASLRYGALVAIVAVAAILAALNGDVLAERLSELVDAGNIDAVRADLWDAALRMISDSPLLGLGLGTFQDAYPLYASQALPFLMDKAHNDYLEFAAGVGLPAAIAWWLAALWLCIDCAMGPFRRRRNREIAIMAFGATVLIAVHSAFDFSLQIPAVAFLYATLLGIGLAQAHSHKEAAA
jgi:O-antigen ligase